VRISRGRRRCVNAAIRVVWIVAVVVTGLLTVLPAAAEPAESSAERGSAAAEKALDGLYFPETFTLDNGMQVIVVTNRRVPAVTHMVWYRVGAADEPDGKSGIAHFLEHLMFKGTDELEPGEFSEIVARNGGRDNAFTSWDYTAFYQMIARDRLPLVMKMEADRMTNIDLSSEAIETERAVVLEERRQRVDNDPEYRLGEQFNATMYMNHPYGDPVIGWEHEVANLSQADIESFYRHWYAPNNAILIVSGDIDAETLRPLAEKYYGVIPPADVPTRVRPVEPPVSAERHITMRDAKVQQTSLRRGYLAPSYNHGDREQIYGAEVLAQVLGGDATSRLYRELVVEQKLATTVSLNYRSWAVDYGLFTVWLTPASDQTPQTVEAALDRIIRDVLVKGVTAEEVATAKRRLLAQSAFARDSMAGPAFVIGTAVATGVPVEEVESWRRRIEAVTPEAVNAAANTILDTENVVTGYLLPDARQES